MCVQGVGMAETIAKFVAIIPGIQSAFKIGGEGDGRLTLDVPESELPEVMKLIAFGRDKALTITIEVE